MLTTSNRSNMNIVRTYLKLMHYLRLIWRGRMGVEPTGAGITDAHAVLKTGEATGPLPPPWSSANHWRV